MKNIRISKVDFDCDKQIGQEKYTFFIPIEIGEFIISIWTRPKITQNLSLSIYENGELISPKDPRIKNQIWAEKLYQSWTKEIFSIEEVENILFYLETISQTY